MSPARLHEGAGEPHSIDASSHEAAALDPVGAAVVQAMARRAEAQQGQAQQLMLRRMERLLAEMEARASASRPSTQPEGIPRQADALASLSELVERLGRSSASTHAAPPLGAGQQASAPMVSPPRPLKAVVEFKGTWSRLRAEQRLREALAQVPASAGPLNTSHLVNRALQAMHELSPAYLEAFMLHVDALLGLEQASGGGEMAARPAAPSAGKPRSSGRGGRKG